MFQIVPDDELIEQIRFENDYALDLLLDRYSVFIHKWIDNLKPQPKKDYAEDIFQFAILRFLECIRSYDPKKGNFFSYVKSCVQLQIMHYSNGYENYKNKTIVKEDLVFSLADNSPAFILEDRRLDFHREVKNCLELNVKISPKERRIFMMYMTGYGYGEIAEKCEIDKKTVDNILQKIKKILIGILQ